MIGSDNKNVYKVLAISRISPTIIIQITSKLFLQHVQKY